MLNGDGLDLILIRNFAIAVFIGALVGVERERKADQVRQFGGLRTFTLISLAGGISAWLDSAVHTQWLFPGGGAALTVLVAGSYYAQMQRREHVPGLTTEVSAVITYMLGGATVFGFPELAVAIAIVVSGLLAMKTTLHDLVGRITEDDLVAMLKLLFATFIVLPLLPDEPIDPLGVLNLWRLWWLVILISALSLVGYIAVRWLGPGRGLAVTGLFGGLVSSTAVTLSFARRSQVDPGEPNLLAMATMIAWVMMFVRVAVIVALLDARLLGILGPPLVVLALVTGLVALTFYRMSHGEREGKSGEDPELRNPFSLSEAMKFGVVFAGVLLLVGFAQQNLPAGYLYVVAALGGTTTVDAISLSFATLSSDGDMPRYVATVGILIAAMSNTWVKAGIVGGLGGSGLARRVWAAAGLLTLTAAVVVAALWMSPAAA